MPARPNRRKRLLIKPRKRGKFRLYSYLIIVFLVIFTCLYFLFSRQFWNDKEKLILAIQEKNGDVVVATFDPTQEEITTLIIPENTEVNVARGLGIWKIRSVWRLGEDEKLAGNLLSQTLIRHFKFPVSSWADSSALGFTSKNPVNLIKAVLIPYKTNLTVGDKVGIVFFAFRVGNTKRIEINLAETSFLKKTTFIDGEEGYVVVGVPSPALAAIFADPVISKKAVSLVIKDATGEEGIIPQDVGRVLEVFGLKVASIIKEGQKELDCLVSGKDKGDVKKVAKILSCGINENGLQTNFDLEIVLGKEFAGRF